MSNAHTQSLLELLPEPHCVIGRDFVCLDANTPFATLVGISVPDLKGAPATRFWPAAAQARWENREFRAEFTAGSGQPLVVKVASFAGRALVVRVLASLSSEQSVSVFHNQRLETLGLLAGGVAHDFNNILTGMLGHVAYLRHVLPQAGDHVESIAAIEEGALRASSLTQQILKFSKVDSADLTSRVDLSEVITRVLTLLKSAIPSNISVRWSPQRDAPTSVLASEAQLSQVVINLLVNARDAIRGRGEISVSLEPRYPADRVESLFGREPPAPAYGAIVVRDSGEGMDQEVMAKLFEPYFTTKKERGTGLGLFTVNSIVNQLGGAIEVESSRGAGTEFRIVLPVVLEESAPNSPGASVGSGPARGNGERILVVDDEYAVRNVLGLSLSHLGYSVETAASGLEAIDKFSAAEAPFKLVILDLLMPGLSGEEVFMRMRAMNPAISVLIVSGFSSEQVVNRILEVGGRDFIQKPFSIEVLARKVRGCLSD